jgi:uncharacterized short protein YbdD (DUF466 family)
MEDSIEKYIENNKPLNAQTGLNSFDGYVTQKREFHPEKEHISNAVREFDEIKDLRNKGLIPDKEYENIRKEILETIKSRKSNIGGPSKLERVKNFTSQASGRRTFIIIVLGLVVFLYLIALYLFYSGAGFGILSTTGGSAAFTEIIVHQNDSNTGEQRLGVEGEATGKISGVNILLLGPGTDETKEVETTEGMFAADFVVNESGSYEFQIQPIDNNIPSISISTTVSTSEATTPSSSAGSASPPESVDSPQLDETIPDRTINIQLYGDAARFGLSILDESDVVKFADASSIEQTTNVSRTHANFISGASRFHTTGLKQSKSVSDPRHVTIAGEYQS